jgi:hypothetical protein
MAALTGSSDMGCGVGDWETGVHFVERRECKDATK